MRAGIGALLILVIFEGAPTSAGAGEEPAKTTALIAMSQSAEDEALVHAAALLQGALVSEERVKLMPVGELVSKLSLGRVTGAARADREQLEGLFQKGYIQSYSFKYTEALATFRSLLEQFYTVEPDERLWSLWQKARLFEGICLLELGKKKEAERVFLEVMRTRPKMKLDQRQYPPKFISFWNSLRGSLAMLPRGTLRVETQPAGARVLLDGMEQGYTPYNGKLPRGEYLLVVEKGGKRAVRKVLVSKRPARVRVQLDFEGAIHLGGEHPALVAPTEAGVPAAWWPWLGERTGCDRVIVVRRSRQGGKQYLAAAVVEPTSGKVELEGRIALESFTGDALGAAVEKLAEFLSTGKSPEGVVAVGVAVTRSKAESSKAAAVASKAVPRAKPWWRKPWTYGGAAVGCAVLAITGHVLSAHFDDKAGKATAIQARDRYETYSNAWLGLAITFDVLALAGAVTAGVLHYRKPGSDGVAVVPALGAGYAGLSVAGWFDW